jgi:polysaccharide deacetylase family protein (PEP-CTERM system associated)
MSQVVNALTVDVEDYFQVSALAPYIERSRWESIATRVSRNVEVILELFARHNAVATFFTLGWIAERHPAMVKTIAAAGHEIASHGYGHERASDLRREEFLADLRRSKGLLEDLVGRAVKGYRAPSFSIGPRNDWAFDCVLEAGYEYSSSVYPIRHDHYGAPTAPRFAYQSRPGLLEVPITTARIFRRNWPAGGGGYFRLMPYSLSRQLIQRVNTVEGRPAIFYVHPWEFDPQQPRVPQIDLRTRFRHYLNLHRTVDRIDRLLKDFRWGRVDHIFLTPACA